MSAPPGFNPDTSLLQQNSSAPIIPFRGGGTPVSLEAFYQALLKGQPETIRKTLPENIEDITTFAISVEDGKFVLKMKVKGKKKEVAAEETEKAAAIAAVAASEAANEAEKTKEAIAAVEALKVANEAEKAEEAIAAVAASEVATKAEAEEEEILKKAREFLILEAARAFLRSQRQSDFNPFNDPDIAESLLGEDENQNDNDNENGFGPFQSAPNPENNNVNSNIAATLRNLKNPPPPPITTSAQAALNRAGKKAAQGVATGITPGPTNVGLRPSSRPKYGMPQGSPSPPNPIRAEDTLRQALEIAESVVGKAKRLAETQRGLVKPTRARRGTKTLFSPQSPPGTVVPATSKNVTKASRVAAQLTGTTSTVPVTGAKKALSLSSQTPQKSQ